MSVPLLKTCCQMCILHHVVGDDYNNRLYQNVKQLLIQQLDEGAWGIESLAILDRAVKHLGYFLTPRVILALLPNLTKVLCLKECPAVDEECLDAALKRCKYLQTLDITENPLLNLSKVDLFCAVNDTQLYTTLSYAILEDCPQVKDAHIQTLLRNAPNLQHLNIARCCITDQVFLLDEEKQLAKEACLEVDRRFMKGTHLTYACHLQHVDVSRCSDFTSTGVRHMCTLCGPTLRSVNLAWTKVECTAFLYLSGMGCPSAVKFFMSSGMTNDAMEPLIHQLNQFDSICSDLVNKFANNDGPKSNGIFQQESLSKCDDDVTHIACQPTAIGQCADTELDLETIMSNFSFDRNEPKFEIVCLDQIPQISQLNHERKSPNAEGSVSGLNSDGLNLKADENCCCFSKTLDVNAVSAECGNAIDSSVSLPEGAKFENSTNSSMSLLKTSGHCNSCNALLPNDKHHNLKEENLGAKFLLSHDQLEGLKQHKQPSLLRSGKSSSSDTGKGGVTLELIDLEATDGEPVTRSTSGDMKTYFTPNIANISFNAAVFHDEMLGLRCFQKFLTSNRNLQSLSIFSGISGNCLDDSVLDLIGTYARGLESLSVQGSDRITNGGIFELANNCRNLSSLDLTGVSFVGDEAITSLVDSMPLTNLKLAETLITGQFMSHLATLPLAKTLKEIDLSWCEEMESNSALNDFISACPCLERLMLRECRVSSATLICISQHSHYITELSLASNMSVIQDEGIILLTEHLPMLTNIDLGWNSYLTNPSISALLTNCPLLEKANLEGLKLITSLPFLPIISVPEELSDFLEKRREAMGENSSGGKEEETLELSEVPCFPHRSPVYCTNLQHVNLTYSDFVEDQQLQQIVTITNGGIQVLDYYGNRVEPSKACLESFLIDYNDDRGQRG